MTEIAAVTNVCSNLSFLQPLLVKNDTVTNIYKLLNRCPSSCQKGKEGDRI